MEKIIIGYSSSSVLYEINSVIESVQSASNIRSMVILSCEKNDFSIIELQESVKNRNIPVYGGVFPAIIAESTLLWTGAIVIGFPFRTGGGILPEIDSESIDIYAAVDALCGTAGESGTTMVLIDGLSKRINRFVWALQDRLGSGRSYIGGGAGSFPFVNKPHLLTNDNVYQNAAILLHLPLNCGVGVAHGWEPIGGPFHVTRSEENVLFSLNSRPAVDVYKQTITTHCGRFDNENFFAAAKSYPFGISMSKDEHIVRDPIGINKDGSIRCIGEIPVGAYVDILYGDKETLVSAAGWAQKIASTHLGKPAAECMNFIVDCISRVLFLGEAFSEELAVLKTGFNPSFGICSLGEIAETGSNHLEFCNKTIAVGLFDTPWKMVT